MKVLVLNGGSSSLKYDPRDESGDDCGGLHLLLESGNVERVTSFDNAIRTVFDKIGNGALGTAWSTAATCFSAR